MTGTIGEWFTDDADASRARGLGRDSFVDVVLNGIGACKGRKSSTVLSLVGAWGSGKSSIIDAVIDELEGGENGWRVVHFNPWAYQDLPSLQDGFFSELKTAFASDTKADKTRAKIADFADALAPLGSIAALAGFDATPLAERAAKLIGGDRSATAAQRLLEKVLLKHKSPVLVVMDDLDRLAPDELLLTFKLVRLIGRLPFVHYLLAFDEDTLLDALSRTGLVGDSKSRARDYLEKVVQVRFDVPVLRPEDVRNMVNEALNRILSELDIEMDGEQVGRFRGAYFAHIERRLTTPRAIGRYWAQVRLSLAEISGELDVSDFLILTWLRTAEPGAYRLVQEWREELIGTANKHTRAAREELDGARLALREALSASGTRPAHLGGVAIILTELFPRFGAIWNARDLVHVNSTRQRVSNAEYFDRYFVLGVPEGDIRDATVGAAVHEIASGAHGACEDMLAASLRTSPDLTLAKLEPLLDGSPPAPLVIWLGRHYSDLPYELRMFTSRERAIDLAADLLRRMSTDEVATVVTTITASHGGLPLALQATAAAARVGDGDPPDAPRLQLDHKTRAEIGKIIEKAYDELEVDDPFAIEPDTWSSIWAWAELDMTSLRRWIKRRHSSWGSHDLVARFVATSHLVGGPSETRLADVDFSLLGDLVDLPAIESELAATMDAVESPDELTKRPLENPENRRIVALRQLRARRARRENAGH